MFLLASPSVTASSPSSPSIPPTSSMLLSSQFLCRNPRKSEFICIHIYMTFIEWLLKKEIPDSDRLAMLIRQAGPNGIPETKLRSGIELPKQLVDDLLQALVQSRIARVIERGGIRWYFSLM